MTLTEMGFRNPASIFCGRPAPAFGYHGPVENFGPPEIMRILAVTDALGFHREAMQIPLWTKGKGEIIVKGQRLQITAPETDFEAWLAALPDTMKAMDLSAVRRAY
jgi:hypothetical protein